MQSLHDDGKSWLQAELQSAAASSVENKQVNGMTEYTYMRPLFLAHLETTMACDEKRLVIKIQCRGRW